MPHNQQCKAMNFNKNNKTTPQVREKKNKIQLPSDCLRLVWAYKYLPRLPNKIIPLTLDHAFFVFCCG